MRKSRADIQREYRERKKGQEGEAYIKKERTRVRKYYTPVELLPQDKLKERREKLKIYMRNRRRRQKEEKNCDLIENEMYSNIRINDSFQTVYHRFLGFTVPGSKEELSSAYAPLMRTVNKKLRKETKKVRKESISYRSTATEMKIARWKIYNLKQKLARMMEANAVLRNRLNQNQLKASGAEKCCKVCKKALIRKQKTAKTET